MPSNLARAPSAIFCTARSSKLSAKRNVTNTPITACFPFDVVAVPLIRRPSVTAVFSILSTHPASQPSLPTKVDRREHLEPDAFVPGCGRLVAHSALLDAPH